MFFTRGVGNSPAPYGGSLPTDPAAEAVWTAFTTPATDSRKQAINQLVWALKGAAVWDDLDVLYLMAAADSQAARINWKNPGTKTMSAVNSPTFTADRGFAGNGSNSRLDTTWVPSTDGVKFVQNSASMWVWSNTNSQTSGADCGNASTAPYAYLYTRSSSDLAVMRLNDSSSGTTSSTNSIGMFGAQRRASNDRRLWKNGSQIGSTTTSASTGLPTASMWVCGANSIWFTTKQYGFFAAGASLSGKESDFYNAILTYMQTVGAA